MSALAGVATSYGLYYSNIAGTDWFLRVTELLRIGSVAGAEVVIVAVGFSVMSFVQMLLLVWGAAREFALPLSWLWLHTGRALFAGVVGGFFAYGTITLVVDGVNQDVFIGIFLQGLLGGIAGIIGVVAAYYVTRSPELLEIAHSFRVRLLKTDVMASQDDVL